MADEIIMQQDGTLQQPTNRIDQVLESWLRAKHGKSGSHQTKRKYAQTIADLRATLAPFALDLDSDPGLVLAVVERWAESRQPSPATYNHRLAVVSSFYAYARKMDYFDQVPELDRIEKRKIHQYNKAAAMAPGEARAKLAAIDTTTHQGKRDYAVLSLALTTGRRVSEIAGLRWGDCKLQGKRIHVTFNRAKGGKVMADTLSPGAGRALLTWLEAHYGNVAKLPRDAPLWVSLSRNASAGKPLSTVSLEQICQKHMGVHFHALRHTFARSMEDRGAKVSEIQGKLGHESLQTTGRYLAALRRAENPYSEMLDEAYGIQGDDND